MTMRLIVLYEACLKGPQWHNQAKVAVLWQVAVTDSGWSIAGLLLPLLVFAYLMMPKIRKIYL